MSKSGTQFRDVYWDDFDLFKVFVLYKRSLLTCTINDCSASLAFVPDAYHGKLLFGTSADTVTQLYYPHLLCSLDPSP